MDSLLSLKTELRMVLPKTNTLLIALICGGLPSILDKQNNSQKLVSPSTSTIAINIKQIASKPKCSGTLAPALDSGRRP